MAKVRSLYLGAASLLLAAFAVPQTFVPAQAEQIAATVNTIVITGSDVAKRVKFLQLRGDRKGNLQQKAKQELVEATTQEAVDLAARKVSLLCDS